MSTIKYFLGWVSSIVFPAKTAALYENFTIPQDWNGIIDKMIRFYLSSQAKREEGETPGKLEAIHRNFWAKTDAYFDDTENRTEEVFIPAYGDFIRSLVPLLVEKQIHTVCEFGTGDGKWLDFLSREWTPALRADAVSVVEVTAVSHFIGIDISAHQIDNNKRQYPHLTFYHSDLIEWAEKYAAPHTLYHTNGGVLEYLSEESVRRLFNIIQTRAAGSLVLLNEPLYGDFNLETDTASEVLGNEYSYSHNYLHLLQTAGAQILRHEERTVMGYRMLLVLAYFAAGS